MPKKSQRDEDIGPKVKTIYTIKLNDAQLDQLADYLEDGKIVDHGNYDYLIKNNNNFKSLAPSE